MLGRDDIGKDAGRNGTGKNAQPRWHGKSPGKKAAGKYALSRGREPDQPVRNGGSGDKNSTRHHFLRKKSQKLPPHKSIIIFYMGYLAIFALRTYIRCADKTDSPYISWITKTNFLCRKTPEEN